MIDSATMRAFFIYKDKGMVSKHLLPYVKDFEIFFSDFKKKKKKKISKKKKKDFKISKRFFEIFYLSKKKEKILKSF
jgi:hypothetical protein